jgi:hypothetical protein
MLVKPKPSLIGNCPPSEKQQKNKKRRLDTIFVSDYQVAVAMRTLFPWIWNRVGVWGAEVW